MHEMSMKTNKNLKARYFDCNIIRVCLHFDRFFPSDTEKRKKVNSISSTLSSITEAVFCIYL